MQSLLFAILLCSTLFNMDKQEKQAAQFNKLNATMHKWEAVLANYTVWALSDGILDAAEEKQIDKIQSDIDVIKTRLSFLSKKNGIPLLPIAIAAVPTPTMVATSEEQEITPSETTLEPPNPLEMLASNEETMGLLDKSAEEEDNIPKNAFVKKASAYLKALAGQSTSGNTERVNAKAIITVLEGASFKTPFGEAFIKTVIQELDKENGSISIGTFETILSTAAKTWDEPKLLAHYLENEDKYILPEDANKLDELEIKNLKNDFETISKLPSGLKISTEDVEKEIKAEEEKKKAEEDKKKAEEDARRIQEEKEEARLLAKKEVFLKRFETQLLKQNGDLDAIAIYGDSSGFNLKIMNLDKLKLNKKVVNFPSFTEKMWDEIYTELYSFVKSSNTLVTVSEAKNKVQDLFLKCGKTSYTDQLFEAYLLDGNVIVFPTGFAEWVNLSADATNFEAFQTNYLRKWHDKVYSVVDEYEKILATQGIAPKASRAALLQNIGMAFSRPLAKLNTQPGIELAKVFESFLPKTTIISYSEVDLAWKNTLDACKEKKFLLDLCEKSIVSVSKSVVETTDAIDSIANVLPNQAAIVTALVQSRYWPKQQMVNTNTDTFVIDTEVKLKYLEEITGNTILLIAPKKGAPIMNYTLSALKKYFEQFLINPANVRYEFIFQPISRTNKDGKQWAFATVSSNLQPADIASYSLDSCKLTVVSLVSTIKEFPEQMKAKTTIRVRLELETMGYSFSANVSVGVGAEIGVNRDVKTESLDFIFVFESIYDPIANKIRVFHVENAGTVPRNKLINSATIKLVKGVVLDAFEE